MKEIVEHLNKIENNYKNVLTSYSLITRTFTITKLH